MRDSGRSDWGRVPAGAGQSTDRMLDAMIQTYEPSRPRMSAPRGPALWYGGLALVGLVVVGAMIVLALPPPARQTTQRALITRPTPSATVQATATAVAPPLPAFNLPAFSDWRAAYLTPDGAVHVSTLDGTSDLTGPVLNLNTADTTNAVGPWVAGNSVAGAYTSFAVAPNGRYLAYINALPVLSGAGVAPPDGFLALINLAPDGTASGWTSASIAGDVDVTDIAGWSPDSTRVVMDATIKGVHGIYTVNPQDAMPVMVPQTGDNGSLAGSRVIGWLDNTHLLLLTTGAGAALPPVAQASAPSARSGAAFSAPFTAPRSSESSNGDLSLATVDVATGTAYEITRVPEATVVALSPEGKEIEAYNSGCGGNCAPLAPEIVDTATGQTHALPNSAGSLAQQGIALWQPGASMLAVTITGQGSPAQWQANLVDTQADSARPLRQGTYTIAWSPDGQYLLLGDGPTLQKDGNQTQVFIVSPSGSAAGAALPHQVAAFIGFVKTA